jgi:hypothetical protein
LAWRSAEHDIDFPITNAGRVTDFFSAQSDNGSRHCRARRKIECMRSSVNGIVFNRRHDIEASLFKTQTEAADTAKEIYANGTHECEFSES